MSLARYRNTRDRNEPPIVRALEGIGASVFRLDRPCDLLVGYRGRNHLLEVKAPLGPRGGASGSPLTPEQVEFQRTWRGSVAIVRSPGEALEAIGASAIAGTDCTP